MSKVRVYEVAKQLNMDQKTLVALFQSMGIGDVRNYMSAVDLDAVERVKRHLERQKSPEVVEERIRPTVVKRRARPAEEAGVPQAKPSAPEIPQARGSVPEPAASRPRMPAPPPSRPAIDHFDPVPAARKSSPSAQVAAPVEVHASPVIPKPAASRPKSPVPAPSAPGAVEHPVVVSSPEPATVTKPADAQPSAVVTESVTSAPVEAAPSRDEKKPAAEAPITTGAAAGPAITPEKDVEPAVAAPPPPAPPVKATESSSAPAAVVEPAPVKAQEETLPVAAPPPPPSSRARRPVAKPPTPAIPPAPPAPKFDGPGHSSGHSGGHSGGHSSTPRPSSSPARASSPPTPGAVRPTDPPRAPAKTGIDVWQGRPGVPMPQVQRTTPSPRRQVFDPRANATPARPGGPSAYGPQSRMPGGQRPRQQFNSRGGNQRPGMSINKRPAMVSTQEMASHKKVIKIEEQVSLQQLAQKMSLKATDVLMKLLSMGMTGVNINSTLDADTAKILASEFGWAVEDVAVSETDAIASAMGSEEIDTDLAPRPPIVTVMGHVDHGKTSLLDRIRKATVADGEAGGITQHVGAYRVETSRGTIAFLDTPGHEAFTAMRARGASVTDIVILVVAADDGVMPQTREAMNHAKAAKVPIIVAVNKIDKPGADPEKIKRDLAALGLQPEEWGGEAIFMHVSAKTGEGIDQLLEAVLLQAEVLELRANAKKRASGTVIEALLDRGRGPVARVMVQDGTLRVGDTLLAGAAWGKVRALTNELGRSVAEAGPSTPVEVLGLNEVPSAGDPVHAVKDGKQAEEIAETRRKKASKSLIPPEQRISLEQLTTRLAEADTLELKLIIKGDVQGSVEAVGHALSRLTTQKVKVTIVNAAVGGITEGDVQFAVASKAIIVGFNVRPAGKAAAHAEAEGVEIRLYNIIYNAVDDIRSAMEGLLPATKIEKSLGRAEVRQVFRITKIGIVAGCMVLHGLMKRTGEARLIRSDVVVWTGKLSGLRRFKDDAKEVAEGFECGISLDNFADVKEGDIIESFEIEEIKTKLT
jgi:translation initiation factor IF-2